MVLFVLCCIRRRGVETSDGAVSVCDGAQTSASLFRGSVTTLPLPLNGILVFLRKCVCLLPTF